MAETPGRMVASQTGDRRMIVWIVEDNSLFRSSLAALVSETEGMECPVAVDSCERMLHELENRDAPDIVLMDIGLPGMSGIEGTREIRCRAPGTRVIMLTVQEEDEKVFHAICAGASGYLLKPLPPERILTAIRDVQSGAAPINGYIARKVLDMFSRFGVSPRENDPYGLTPREREILSLLVQGLIMKEIAARLGLSYHTIDSHLRSIYDKLHVHSRTAVVAKALRERII